MSTTHLKTGCRLGLIRGPEVSMLLLKYAVTRTALKAQVEGVDDVITVEEGSELRFSESPFGPKVCPGSVGLEMAISGDNLTYLRLWREVCWSIPPKNSALCPKHFNSRYGRYLRFVFGSAPPDPLNPFFKLPAMLYSIYYGSERAALKVGITLVLKGMRRFLEQPTYLAAPIRLCRNIEEARALEVWFSKASRRFSQAPSIRSRIASVVERLRAGEVTRDAGMFACALLNAVSEAAARRGGPAEVTEVLESVRKCVRIISLQPDTLSLRDVRVCSDVREAAKMLGGRRARFLGMVSGFLVLDIKTDGKVLIPYEFFRDRLVRASLP